MAVGRNAPVGFGEQLIDALRPAANASYLLVKTILSAKVSWTDAHIVENFFGETVGE